MTIKSQAQPLATAAVAGPGLMTQVGMAGSAAVITVSFIHPIDVVKVCYKKREIVEGGKIHPSDESYCG